MSTMSITKQMVYDLEDAMINPEEWQNAFNAEGDYYDYLLARDVAMILGYVDDPKRDALLDDDSRDRALRLAAEWWPSPKLHGPEPIDWATANEPAA